MPSLHRAPAGEDSSRRPRRPADDPTATYDACPPTGTSSEHALARLVAASPGVSNAVVARLVADRPALARSPLSDADRERIDDLIEMHTDLADPEFAQQMLETADDPDEVDLWFELLDDATERAYHYRVVLLLQESKASTTAQVDELLGSAEDTANDESAVIAAIGGSFLAKEAWAFPATWSQRVQSALKPPSDLDPSATAQALSDAGGKLTEAAGQIPVDVLARGLPVAFQPALELRSYPFKFEYATMAEDHAVKTYAIAAKALVAAQVKDALARGWTGGKQALVSDVAAGLKVVDAAKWDAFAAPRSYQPDLERLAWDALRDDVPIIPTLSAEDVDVGRYELALAKLGSMLAPLKRFEFAHHAHHGFDIAMSSADLLIGASTGERRLDIAAAWADARGYPAAARELMIQALKDNADEIALDVAKDLVISAIPVIGWLWRAKEAAEEVSDLVSAGLDLMDAREAVESATTVVALQRAVARLSLQENASAATVAMSVAGTVPGGKKGSGAATNGGGGTHTGTPDAHPKSPGAPDASVKGPDKPDTGKPDTDKPDVAAADPDAGTFRIQRDLPGGGKLKLLNDGRLAICHSPCTFLRERYAREIGDVSSARHARLAALETRERDAIAAGDKVAEEAAFDDAIAFEQELRIEHRQYLGTDVSATGGGRFRAHEATQGEHIEAILGEPLEVYNPTKHGTHRTGDWVDSSNRTWDGVGGQAFFNEAQMKNSVDEHMAKTGVDFIFVDLSGFTPPQRQLIVDHCRLKFKAHIDDARRPFLRVYVDNVQGVL